MGTRANAKVERGKTALKQGGLANAERLRALRCAMGLTQVALGAQLGVENPSISDWETGHKRPGEANREALKAWSERAAAVLRLPSANVTLEPAGWDGYALAGSEVSP